MRRGHLIWGCDRQDVALQELRGLGPSHPYTNSSELSRDTEGEQSGTRECMDADFTICRMKCTNAMRTTGAAQT